MIKFNWSKVDRKNGNTPIIKDSEIDDLAEMLLKDYKPQLLKEPRKINYLHFLESYLGANIEFQDIYYEENEAPIWGATAFNKEYLRIFNREKMRISAIALDRHTVVIDNAVMENGKEGMALFTGLHEGGHLWMHDDIYSKSVDQLTLFKEPAISSVVCCRKGDIESFNRRKSFQTPEEWREHHADYFASAIAMPKATFVPFIRQILRSQCLPMSKIILGADDGMDWFAENELPSLISEAYGVSKTAGFIKLKKFGFVVDEETYHRESAQVTF